MPITDFTVVDWLLDIALTPQGEIIAVGYGEPTPGAFDFVVARYDRHGNLDPSFGPAGWVIPGSPQTVTQTILPLPVTSATAPWTNRSARVDWLLPTSQAILTRSEPSLFFLPAGS